jgi:hypothetical protein
MHVTSRCARSTRPSSTCWRCSSRFSSAALIAVQARRERLSTRPMVPTETIALLTPAVAGNFPFRSRYFPRTLSANEAIGYATCSLIRASAWMLALTGLVDRVGCSVYA